MGWAPAFEPQVRTHLPGTAILVVQRMNTSRNPHRANPPTVGSGGSLNPAASPVVLRGHEGRVNAVAISPDNRWVVTGSADNTARLWLLQVNDLMNLARITVGRNFSANEWRLYFPSEKYRKTFDELPSADESVTQKKQLRRAQNISPKNHVK